MAFIISIIFCACVPVGSYAQSITSVQAQEHFQKGNALYKEGKFAEACQEYSAISAAGLASGEIYFNIGNCYARRGMMGHALVSYERARLLIPQDSDLRANYEFIRSELALPEVTQDLWGKMLDGINEAFPVAMLGIIVLILYACIFVCIGFGIVFVAARRVITSIIFIVFMVTTVGGFAWYRKINFVNRGAIVIVGDAPVRFEPADAGTVYCTLTAGSRIEILESIGAWAKVLRSDGKIGWVQNSAFEKISP